MLVSGALKNEIYLLEQIVIKDNSVDAESAF